jgi:hypothetical protein
MRPLKLQRASNPEQNIQNLKTPASCRGLLYVDLGWGGRKRRVNLRIAVGRMCKLRRKIADRNSHSVHYVANPKRVR